MAANLIEPTEAYENLTDDEKKALNILIGNAADNDMSADKLLIDLCFSDKRVCLFAEVRISLKMGSASTGHKNICRECGRNLLITSNSVMCGTHKDVAAWIKFIGCSLNDESLENIAEKCGIHINTALSWSCR